MKKLPLAILAVACLSLQACNGIFSGLYDEIPENYIAAEGFSINPTQPERLTLTVDASDFGVWNYISLKNKTMEKYTIPLACEGEWDGRSGITLNEVNGTNYTVLDTTPTDPQPEPDEWDIAIHRFDVRTNGGAAAVTGLQTLDGVLTLDLNRLDFIPDHWCDNHVMVDLSDMMALRIGYQNSYVNPVLSDWVKMDISSPPPVFSASGLVYVLRLQDGSAAALKLRSYVNELGIKGHLTIDIIYPL